MRYLLLGMLLCVISTYMMLHIPKNLSTEEQKKQHVGLLIMATGKYVHYVDALLDSADRYFCTDHEVTYFVFTDGAVTPRKNLVTIAQSQLGWPYDTMMRFSVYLKNKNRFSTCDYLFSCDADMLFADHVGTEMFAKRVATIQPNYLFDAKPYERNPLSTAAVQRNEGTHYFAGGFYGAAQDEFIQLLKAISDNISIDLARGYIARHNDESHLNRYFIDHQPTKILSPSYCHFENWNSPYPKKIVALVKSVDECVQVRKKAQFNPLDYYKKYMLNVT